MYLFEVVFSTEFCVSVITMPVLWRVSKDIHLGCCFYCQMTPLNLQTPAFNTLN